MKKLFLLCFFIVIFFSCTKDNNTIDDTNNNTTTLTDIDGNNYPIVKLCNQTWTAKNLNVSRYRNGDIIPQVNDIAQLSKLKTGAWCYYEYDQSIGAKYGKLYNLYAVRDTRGLAPTGWHVSTMEDFTSLGTCLGGSAVAGGKMKETGTVNWKIPNSDASNSSGFNALPGGTGPSFYGLGNNTYWWISDNFQDMPFVFGVHYSDGSLFSNGAANSYAYYVRCVKN